MSRSLSIRIGSYLVVILLIWAVLPVMGMAKTNHEVYIKGGDYVTGEENSYDNPEKIFRTPGFFMDIRPVTNGEYLRFLNRSGYKPSGEFSRKEAKKRPRLPATNLTYPDCVAYARFYDRRLPTEWEWEIAARSLKKENIYVQGKAPDKRSGNFLNSRIYRRVDVMTYPPNSLGLYGMEGNVFEWTSGQYEKSLLVSSAPSGIVLRILRGGSWTTQSFEAKTTTRTPFPSLRTLPWIGFRTVRDKQTD